MFYIKNELLNLLALESSEWTRADTADSKNKTYESVEGGDHFHLEIKVTGANFPNTALINAFMAQKDSEDTWRLIFHNENLKGNKAGHFETNCICDEDSFLDFSDNLNRKDVLRVDLEIEKHTSGRVCNVYEWKAFTEFLLGESANDPLAFSLYLNDFIKAHPEGVGFLVHDEKADYVTRGFAFANTNQNFPHFNKRYNLLDRYNNGSMFMDRANNVLMPRDFHADEEHNILPKEREKDVREALCRFETMYSLIFLAAMSWFEKETSVIGSGTPISVPKKGKNLLALQMIKGGLTFRIPVTEIYYNKEIYNLVAWTFAKNGGPERAGIVREIISRYCRNENELLSIGSNILESAKSGHNLYTIKAVDQYVKLKSDLSKSILESTKQVQVLIESLIEGLGKNFVAVITVITAQVLAGHINWDTYADGKFRTEDFKSVIWIFVAASGAYMIANIITTIFKWAYYRDRYNLMRDQYKSLLDEVDLNRAFDNDKLIKSARIKLIIYALIIFILWALLIAAVLYFGIFYVKVPT